MSYTYAELTQAIKDYTDNTETSFVTHIPDFVKNAEERLLKNVHHSVFKTSSTISLVTDQEFYLLPAETNSVDEFLAPISLMLTDTSAGETYFLEQKDFTFVKDLNTSTTSNGKPTHYAIKNINSARTSGDGQPRAEILIAPRPSSTYNTMVLTLEYVYRPTSLVDTDADTAYQESGENGRTWISTNAPRAILFGSLVEAAIYLKSAPETLAIYEQQFQESLMGLKKLGESMEHQDEFRYGAIVREKV